MSHHQTELLCAPREVDVVTIERELTALWKEAAEGITDGSASPVVRACALNLIVVAGPEGQIAEIEEMVGQLTAEHPARLFLIVADPTAQEPKLDAWISARCSIPVPGGKQVCCEQINLTAHSTEAEKIPSIVTALLVSDVPGVLLWKAPLLEGNSVLMRLADVLDRVLIDSSEDLRGVETLTSWHAFIDKHRGHVIFGDLAWTHLTPWRSVIANAFNPKDLRPLLADIRSVTISYSTTSTPKHSGLSQALLLMAWFASKLQWQAHSRLHADGAGHLCQWDGGKRKVLILPAPPRPGKPGGIESVCIQAGEQELTFAATQHQHCVRFKTAGDGLGKDEMLTVLTDRTEATLVAQELEVLTRDMGYETVLRTLATVMNQ